MRYGRVTLGIICVVALGVLLHGVFDRPIRYEIPGEYKGWMVVQFEKAGCPPLRRQAIFRVVSIPPSGRVCTSDHHPDHLTYYKFEYIFSDGSRESLAGTNTENLGHKLGWWAMQWKTSRMRFL